MTMSFNPLNPVVIGGTGRRTPPNVITDAEAIAAGERAAQPGSSVVLIVKAAGIKVHLYHQDLATGDHGLISSFGAGYAIARLEVRKR